MPLATFQQNDRLGEIVIDSPPLNLFSADLLADLRAAVDQAADGDIRALLVRAEGDDFSAGADVSIFSGLDETRASELETTVLSLIAAIEDLPVPRAPSPKASRAVPPVLTPSPNAFSMPGARAAWPRPTR
jgi:enoyl-CoA hydratase/carnithine racemase